MSQQTYSDGTPVNHNEKSVSQWADEEWKQFESQADVEYKKIDQAIDNFNKFIEQTRIYNDGHGLLRLRYDEIQIAKIAKLKERIKAKTEKIDILTKERDALETECADLVSDQNVAGTETKTGPVVPEATSKSKDSSAKTPPAKKK